MKIYRKAPDIYAMCNQTVTVYHKDGETITRTVYREKAFFDDRKTQNVDRIGSREANSFLLVIPGNTQTVFVGDKVIHGEGPEIKTLQEWASFIPVKVPGLAVVGYADPKYWNDQIVHTEAGG